MRLSVNVSLPGIERTLNQAYEGELFRDSVRDWTGGDSEVVVKKAGPITLTGAKTYVKGEIPVSIQVEIRQKDPGLLNALKSIAGIRRLDASIRAIFRIHLHLQTDLSIAITVDPEFVWIKKPTIGSLLPVKISAWLEPAIQRGLDQQAEDIRIAILEKLGLPESLHLPWEQIFTPIQIDPNLPLFAKAQSLKREVGITPLDISPQRLSTQLALPISIRMSLDPLHSGTLPIFPVGLFVEEEKENNRVPVTSLISAQQFLRLLPGRYQHGTVTMEDDAGSILLTKVGVLNLSLRVFPTIRESDQMLIISHVSVVKAGIFRPVKKWMESLILQRANHSLETRIHEGLIHLEEELRHKHLGAGWVLDVPGVTARFLQCQIRQDGLLIEGELRGTVGLHLDDL